MRKTLAHIDWILVLAILPLLAAGLVTMQSFVSANTLFAKQLAWILVSFGVFLAASMIDWRFLRRSGIVTALYGISVVILFILFLAGTKTLGAVSRFNLGGFFVQPSEPIQLVLIALLAKYFSRRHVEIAHYKHILISGLYAFVLFTLLFFQPDFGSAIILFLIWFGMILVSGISLKHLAIVGLLGAVAFGGLWQFGFQDYQRFRKHYE